MDSVVRNAIARIDIVDDGTNISRGTGCLVSERLMLTALHVVADRFQTPPVPAPGTITLKFPEHTTEAVIYGAFHDQHEDWALLECVTPLPVRPLPLADLRQSRLLRNDAPISCRFQTLAGVCLVCPGAICRRSRSVNYSISSKQMPKYFSVAIGN